VQDSDVLSRIDQLAREEHELWNKESRGDATEEDRLRLRRIQVTLDQCWDYLTSGVPSGMRTATPTKRKCATRIQSSVTCANEPQGATQQLL